MSRIRVQPNNKKELKDIASQKKWKNLQKSNYQKYHPGKYSFSPPLGAKHAWRLKKDQFGETVQEGLLDEETVVIYQGKGHQSKKIFQGNIKTFLAEKKEREEKMIKRRADIFADILKSKKTIFVS